MWKNNINNSDKLDLSLLKSPVYKAIFTKKNDNGKTIKIDSDNEFFFIRCQNKQFKIPNISDEKTINKFIGYIQ